MRKIHKRWLILASDVILVLFPQGTEELGKTLVQVNTRFISNLANVR